MARLANISAKKAIRSLEKMGYSIARKSGSHIIMKHPKRPTITLPDHKELAPGLLRAIITQAGLDVDTFIENLP